MKRFEDFNQMFGSDESAEEQALGMIISHIKEAYEIEIKDVETLKKRYTASIKWLNEEIETGGTKNERN